MRKNLTWLSLSLILITLCLGACGGESNPAPAPTAQPTPSPTALDPVVREKIIIQNQLTTAWQNYRNRFIQADGRVIDFSQADITTSEGQSYALLRAVWENDQEHFKQVLSWTRSNLQIRVVDKLFAYKWGKTADGNWQTLDNNNATDADTDIGLALVFAGKQWNNQDYTQQAQGIISDLWQKNVVMVQGKPYLTAGIWAVSQGRPAINPSYLAPYAYRIFAKIDPTHDWLSMVDSAYEIINGCSHAQLSSKGVSINLPPNFCGIDTSSGQFTTAQDYPSLNTDYSYDAFRTMWRVALDYKWNNEPRAKAYLDASSFLREQWKEHGQLAAGYSHDGTIVQSQEDLAIYSGNLGNFLVTDPTLAEQVVQKKLLPTFQQITDQDPTKAFTGWGDKTNYYNQNWVWFGLALYADKLPDLSGNVVAKDGQP